MTVVIDACSFVHFLASGEQRIVLEYAKAMGGDVAVCDKVADEIHGILANKPKFTPTGGLQRWNQLQSEVTRLSDNLDLSPGLDQSMVDLHKADANSAVPLAARLTSEKDVGEFLSAAHALRLARQGTRVVVVVDDRGGRTLVFLAQQSLLREGRDSKLIIRTSTRTIVEKSRDEWRRDGLTPAQTLARMQQIESIPRW